MQIPKEDWGYEKEFNEWFAKSGPKHDQEDDPDGEVFIKVKWWAWEAWRASRRVNLNDLPTPAKR